MKYRIFHRTWWKHNKNWPDSREPCAGKQIFVSWADTELKAQELCMQWNLNHKQGLYSDKAEYSEV